jgi:hypothetical protein
MSIGQPPHYIFASLAAAQACAVAVDAAMGYPRASTLAGGGYHHMPPFVTQTHALPVKHPTLSQWVYPASAITTPILAPQAVALTLPVPIALDATWTPVHIWKDT